MHMVDADVEGTRIQRSRDLVGLDPLLKREPKPVCESVRSRPFRCGSASIPSPYRAFCVSWQAFTEGLLTVLQV